MDFDITAEHKVKLKESEKKAKHQDFARELKNLWKIKVTEIPIVIVALGTVTEGLILELEDLEIKGWLMTTQMAALLRLDRILNKVLEIWGDVLSLRLQWKISANVRVKNSQMGEIMIIILKEL